MTRGGYVEDHPAKRTKKAQRGVDSLSKRPSPVTDYGVLKWAMITDGWAETNDGVLYPIGGQFYGTNDLTADYFTFTERNTTYPNNNGSEDYYTVQVETTGIYLIDMVGAWDWQQAGPGVAFFDPDPNAAAHAPFGFGGNEEASWYDQHPVEDTESGLYGEVFRCGGIASLAANTDFLPKVKQASGTNGIVFAFNYLKVVLLQPYEPLSELLTDSLF